MENLAVAIRVEAWYQRVTTGWQQLFDRTWCLTRPHIREALKLPPTNERDSTASGDPA
jgi:hypothetical protein